jgi:Gram-negative bacterial TonB protein C-terminal
MKKIILVPITIVYCILIQAQDTASFKLNGYFRKTQDEKYFVYTRKMQKADSVWSFTDYSKINQIIQKGFFTDTACNVPVGHLEFYDYGSKLYEGNHMNGRPAGYWYFYKNGIVADSLFYTYTQPVKKTQSTISSVQQEKEAALKNEHLKKNTAAPVLNVEKFAEFPGGLPAWRQYLIKNLFVPELAMETSPYSQGTVYVQFVVCKDGELCSIEALNSVHPLVDLVAVKAIRKGPRWQPAVQNGKEVKAYQRQPITFILQQD